MDQLNFLINWSKVNIDSEATKAVPIRHKRMNLGL